MKKVLALIVALLTLATVAYAAGGFDQYGYNYQAQSFNGRYCDFDRVIGGDFCDVQLSMKWSYYWLNPDRQRGCDRKTGVCTGTSTGWLTNHQRGTNPNGSHWEYFVKIVYTGESHPDGFVYPNGGYAIWGVYEVIQEVYNDPSVGANGKLTLANPPGFGTYK